MSLVFNGLFPMLGNFHLTKVLFGYAGCCLIKSGINDVLIEGKFLLKKILVPILSGGHYARSLQVMFIVIEAFYLLACKAFWETK